MSDGAPNDRPSDVAAPRDAVSASETDGWPGVRFSGLRWLPFGLAAAVLVALNVGMYTRLSAEAAEADVSAMPYTVTAPVGPTQVDVAREAVAVVAGPGQVRGRDDRGYEASVVATPRPTSAAATRYELPRVGTTAGNVPTGPSRTIFSDTFDGGSESAWLPLDGTWSQVDGRMLQDQSSGFDLSIVHREAVAYPLTWRATFQHRQGSGAGLLFDLPAPDSRRGGHMVRYMGAGDTIAWGYFDDRGVFTGQGGAPVATPGTSEHTLEVRADGQTYDVILDGKAIAEGVPIEDPVSPSRVGLLTSESVVSFLEATLLGTDQAESAGIARDVELRAVNGNWLSEDGVFTQVGTGNTDYFSGIGLSAEDFVVSAEILLPSNGAEEQIAGAGFLFSMPEPSDLGLSYLVRFGSGGRELFWGRYGEDQVFLGEGGVLLEPRPGEPRKLQLSVDDARLDIVVDDQMIATGVPIEGSAGWLGLVSFGGPVTFSDVEVRPTK